MAKKKAPVKKSSPAKKKTVAKKKLPAKKKQEESGTVFYSLFLRGEHQVNIAFAKDKVIGVRSDYAYLMGKTLRQVKYHFKKSKTGTYTLKKMD